MLRPMTLASSHSQRLQATLKISFKSRTGTLASSPKEVLGIECGRLVNILQVQTSGILPLALFASGQFRTRWVLGCRSQFQVWASGGAPTEQVQMQVLTALSQDLAIRVIRASPSSLETKIDQAAVESLSLAVHSAFPEHAGEASLELESLSCSLQTAAAALNVLSTLSSPQRLA
jgi:hypothetical protein